MYTGIRLNNIRREYRMILYEKIKKNKTNSSSPSFFEKISGIENFSITGEIELISNCI